MNALLWVFQIILALHTIMGALWKFSKNAEQTMASLKAIPDGIWVGMGVLELLCSIILIAPAVYKPLTKYVPVAAIVIVIEMLVFCGLHLASAEGNYGHVVYWLVVAGFASFIAYGRYVIRS